MAQYNSHAYLRPTLDQLPAIFSMFLKKFMSRRIRSKKALADVLDKSMRATAKEAVRIAANLAPFDEGTLKRSIHSKKIGPVKYLIGSNLVYAPVMEYFEQGPGGLKSRRRKAKVRGRRKKSSRR